MEKPEETTVEKSVTTPHLVKTEKQHKGTKFWIGAISMPKQVKSVHKFFSSLGLDKKAKIVPGVLRSTLNVDDLVKKGTVDKSYVMTAGTASHKMVAELATNFAHGKAIRHFLNSTAKYGIIFEDDVQIIDGVLNRIPGGDKGFLGAIDTMIKKAPKDFDEMNLGRCDSECQRQSLVSRLSDKAFLVASRYQYCSLAYVLTRTGAKKVDKMIHDHAKYSNDQMKVLGFEFGDYHQISLQPRMFATSGRCGVNSCGTVRECANEKVDDEFNCGKKVFDYKTATEKTLDCTHGKV
jgi:hypothetical protein